MDLGDDVLSVIYGIDDQAVFGLVIVGQVAIGLELAEGKGDDLEHRGLIDVILLTTGLFRVEILLLIYFNEKFRHSQ